jgi:CheY-like chemotaxis protein
VKHSGESLSEEEEKRFNKEGFQFDLENLESGQGSSLGLHMSKGIAEQHGGRVRFTARGLKQRGSCFRLVLPSYDIPESTLPDSLKNWTQSGKHSHNPSEDAEASRFPKPARILVVDDSKVCRKMLIRLLTTKGYDACDEAENGLRGLEMVKAGLEEGKEYDIILMDSEMPTMKGPESVKEIRRLGCTAFIAGVTGNLLPEDVQCFKQEGVDCVLPKPLNISDLESRWAEHGITTRDRG